MPPRGRRRVTCCACQVVAMGGVDDVVGVWCDSYGWYLERPSTKERGEPIARISVSKVAAAWCQLTAHARHPMPTALDIVVNHLIGAYESEEAFLKICAPDGSPYAHNNGIYFAI